LTSNPATGASSVRYELVDPDVRLMLEVRNGNAAAFEQLVHRYRDRLLTVLGHTVANADLAEDLAQEVFLRVYRARRTYQPDARFSTWLFTIANNVASNALRRRARRREVNMRSSNSGSMPSPTLDELAKAASAQMPARQLDRAELADMVKLAVASLSDRQRIALMLSKFEHMSYEDIARAMDLSTPAVKSLLSRARCNLRDILRPFVERGQLPGSTNPATDPSQELAAIDEAPAAPRSGAKGRPVGATPTRPPAEEF